MNAKANQSRVVEERVILNCGAGVVKLIHRRACLRRCTGTLAVEIGIQNLKVAVERPATPRVGARGVIVNTRTRRVAGGGYCGNVLVPEVGVAYKVTDPAQFVLKRALGVGVRPTGMGSMTSAPRGTAHRF